MGKKQHMGVKEELEEKYNRELAAVHVFINLTLTWYGSCIAHLTKDTFLFFHFFCIYT